jgi:uncharacterized RDD family membrane protein YckC
MAKRKRRKSTEPTLFDLPLHGPADEPDSEDAGDEETSRPEEVPAPGRTVGPGPSLLFDTDDPQLDRLELASGGAEPAATEDAGGAPGAQMPPDEGPDEKAYLGDRLLGGLADLAAQWIALGLAIAAVHALGIAVTIADWQPFGVLAAVFSFLYWCVPLAFWGRTPGMAWVGHTARSSNGEPLSFGQTFLRWLGSVLTLALAGLPLLLALSGRSLTDRISDSRTTGAAR